MELLAIFFMIFAGGAVAVLVMTAVAISQRERARSDGASPRLPDREQLAASILFHIVTAGGTPPNEAFRVVRREAGLAAPVTSGVDVANWGERYADVASPPQRAWLLETAVQLIALRTSPVPLAQYTALLDLSFALGFQTDALARLRERYRFEYIDPAKAGRPREADRVGGGAPLFERVPANRQEYLRVLMIEGEPTRQEIMSAYRRLAAQHHPDRFHGEQEEIQTEAATRFIEITRAYEALMAIYRD